MQRNELPKLQITCFNKIIGSNILGIIMFSGLKHDFIGKSSSLWIILSCKLTAKVVRIVVVRQMQCGISRLGRAKWT